MKRSVAKARVLPLIASAIVLMQLGGALASILVASPGVYNAHAATAPVPSGRRIGFWITAEYDALSSSGTPYNLSPFPWTPQQFFNNYFMTPPYPAAMFWVTNPEVEAGGAAYLNQVAALADQYPNIQIVMMFFVNLSNYSVITGYSANNLLSMGRCYNAKLDYNGICNPGPNDGSSFFTVHNSLTPNTAYTIQLQDHLGNAIANILSVTTNSTGGFYVDQGIPNTNATYSYYSSYYYIVKVLGTTAYQEVFLDPDMTPAFTTYLNTIKGHSSIYGAMYEQEYYGGSPNIYAKFNSIVSAAGYQPTGLRYTCYPFVCGGGLPTGPMVPGVLGYQMGYDGPWGPNPGWTHYTVTNIVNNSSPYPIMIMIATTDASSNPIGSAYMMYNPTLRGWIWNDPYYRANYLLANGNTTTTTSTYATSPSTTTTPSGTPPGCASLSGVMAAPSCIDVSFSSLTGYTYQYAPNFGSSGGIIQVQVPHNIEINTAIFRVSDRAYDPNNITIYFQTASGQTLATGTMTEWGPYGYNGDFVSYFQLSSVITLQANVRYHITFSQPPSPDGYGSISQDIFQTRAVTATAGYLGQTTWPIFSLGLMNILPVSSGLAFHDYGSFTDLFNSPGYKGSCNCYNYEVGLRFKASYSEQITSFEVYAIQTDNSSNPLVFTLRTNQIASNGITTYPTPLSVAPALATSSVTAAQVQTNLSASSTSGTFVKVNFPNVQLQAGNYYWIVMAAPNGDVPVTLARLVNPYRALVAVSSDDFVGGSWGIPADGPSDLSFKIKTTSESIINTIIGQSVNDYFTSVAQSFTPTATAQIKGVWTDFGVQGQAVDVSVQTDSGDGPSGTILAQSTVSYGGGYTSLPTATLNAGTEYWLVITNVGCAPAVLYCGAPNSAIDDLYGSDMGNPFQSGSHFEYKSGSTWTSPANLAEMSFAFVSPTGHEDDSIWDSYTATTTTTSVTTTQTSTSAGSGSYTATTTTTSATTTQTASSSSFASTTSFLSSYSSSSLPYSSPSSSSSATTTSETTPGVTSTFMTTYSTYSVPASNGCYQSPCSGVSASPTVTIQSNTAGPVEFVVDGTTYSTPAAFVWPSDSNHTLTLTSQDIDTSVEKSTFLGWAGSINSPSTSLNFTVKGNMHLDLDFRNLCLVSIGFTDVEGRPLNPTSVQIATGSQTLNLTSPSVWLYSGTYQITQAFWKGVEVKSASNSTISFNISKPGSLPVMLPISDEEVIVTDVYGFPVQGAIVTLAAGGVVQEMVTNRSGIALFPQLPPGPIQGTIKYLTFSQSFQSSTVSSHVIYATASLSYPLLATILGVASVAFYFIVRSIQGRSRFDGPGYRLP